MMDVSRLTPLKDEVGKAGGRLTLDEHRERLAYAQRYPLPSMALIAHKWAGERVIICGGGASLTKSLPAIRTRRKLSKRTKIMACNKTHDFLLSKGIVPDFGIMLDPKEWVKDYMTPHRDVIYLLGSTLHPDVLDKFKEAKAKAYIYHPIGDGDSDYLLSLFPAHQNTMAMIAGYSTVGLRSVYASEVLGFDEIHLHGFDSCYDPGAKDLYAYAKPNTVHDPMGICVQASDGTEFKAISNRMMSRQVTEFQDMVYALHSAIQNQHMRPISLKVAGDGAIPWLAWKLGIHANPELMQAKYGKAPVFDYTSGKAPEELAA